MTNTNSDLNKESSLRLMQVALNRSDLYQLLAIAFRDPTPELVEGLLSGSFRSDTADCVAWLNADSKLFEESLLGLDHFASDIAGRNPDDILTDMKVEYTRLLIGPGEPAVSPFQTSYCDNSDEMDTVILFNSSSARATERAYKEAGVSPVSSFQEPSDHIATELEFLMYLCTQEAVAWKEGDIDTARNRRRQEREFIDGFLGKWIYTFCHKLSESTNHEAYRVVASLTQAFLQVEQGVY